jgi:hypothetical protein
MKDEMENVACMGQMRYIYNNLSETSREETTWEI